MVRVKICGITNIDDALEAVRLGVDALGFVFAPSPRQIEPHRAKEIINKLPPWVPAVGVFVNEKPECILQIVNQTGLDWVQLHGEESPDYCRELGLKLIKSLRVKGKSSLKKIPEYPVGGILLDTYDPSLFGGTGKSFNWDLAIEAKHFGKPIILAGGLNSENVKEAISKVQPYGVDVSSGVESSPGKKDYEKMQRFMEIVNEVAPRSRWT